jgi:oligopeptidase A
MNVVFSRSRVLARNGSSVRLPVAHMVCNQMPPVGDKPSLMTFREVSNTLVMEILFWVFFFNK